MSRARIAFWQLAGLYGALASTFGTGGAVRGLGGASVVLALWSLQQGGKSDD